MKLHNLPRLLVLLISLTASLARGTAPDRIEGLGLWLVAGDLASRHRDGQVVTCWPDRSGNAYDAVYESRIPQAGLVVGLHNPPTYRAAGPAGKPVVSFKAENRDGLILNRAGHALGQKTPGFTAIFLIRPTLTYGPKPTPESAWTKSRYVFLTHVSDYNTRFSLQIVEGTGEVKVFSRPAPAQVNVTRNSSFTATEQVSVRDGVWQRVMGVVDYRSKVARIVIDGRVIERPLPPDSANLSEDVPSPITGIGSTTLGDWLSCDIAEVLCYNRALTVEELLTVDAYLNEKYRLKR